MIKEGIISELADHIGVVGALLSSKTSEIEKIVQLLVEGYKKGGRMILMGNGGSAADAQHLAAELVGRYQMERRPLSAFALTTNTSIMTAIGNDYGYDKVFSRQIEALVNPNDVVIGISTSGNSENVLQALIKAKEMGAKTVGFTGIGGGKMAGVVDVLMDVPTKNTPRIQEGHLLVGHIICGLLEKQLFPTK